MLKQKNIIILLAITLTLAISATSYGFPSILDQFTTRYGTAATPLNTCLVCHQSLNPAPPNVFNPYGNDLFANVIDFASIESLDSDLDGFTNLAEINARTFPGNPASTPVPTTFADVPANHPFFSQIEAVAAAGISGGCATTPARLFCPDAPITRGQMAVFLEVSAGRAVPVACSGTRFSDVTPTSVGQAACNFIEAFANAGITAGCGPGIFCPNDPVSRGQMAVFLEVATGGVIGACAGTFTDVTAANPFCGFVERLALDGITGGCGAGNFCPNNPVTRGQMAVFLVAAPILLPLP